MTTIEKFEQAYTWANKELSKEYARYYTAMVNDKMIPLSMNAWMKAKASDDARWHKESSD